MRTNTYFWDNLAIQSYKTLIKDNPDNPMLHKNLGLAYSRVGKQNKAIRSMQRAIKLDKDYLEAYYHIGNIYESIGKKTEAIRAFSNYHKRAAELNKQSAIVGDLIHRLKEETN